MLFIIFSNSTFYFSFLKGSYERKIKVDAIKVIVAIAKIDSSALAHNRNIRDSSEKFFLTLGINETFCETTVFILFQELMKEGIMKNEKELINATEEMLYIAIELSKKTIIIEKNEDFVGIFDNFINIAKEKGFNGELHENKNEVLGSLLFLDWMEFCKDVYIFLF